MFAFVIPLVLVELLVAIGVNEVAKRLLTGAVRWCTEAAVYCLLAAVAMYAWGASMMFNWDIQKVCRFRYGEKWDPAYVEGTFFPLSQKCNASFDLVPSYVNPAVVALAVATGMLAAFAAGAAIRRFVGNTAGRR